ncbi:hypothetical protein BDZ94DRAFT_1269754 [Collybia nuda]|uniref:Uncharacterized protein n=1 Tax=Collybia nuda TaxID=64659 RepID=A0A9P5Y051_9AGAR|nr:hypothetical protein BDZ94DRAFT_1269754 [Collybia nuda]
MARQIILDDTYEKIQYTGQGWFLDDTGSNDGVGSYGPTYLHTLHGTNSNGNLTFNFEGISIVVRGTLNLTKTQPTGLNLSWECFIDKISINALSPPKVSENNWDLCNKQDLDDGSHEIFIEVVNNDQIFLVDYILYTPFPSFSPEDAVVVVENIDPDITYDLSWRGQGDGNMTQTNGSTAEFSFVGRSLSWIGFIPNEFSHAASSATYSIDGSPPTSFQLNGLPPGTTNTLFHQTFFTTPELRAGSHNLLVTHHGTDQQTPLTLDYLHVTTGLGPPPTAPPQLARRKPPIGIIVGAVVGGMTVVSFCLFLFWLYRKRHPKIHLGGNTDGPSSDLAAYPFVHLTLPHCATVKCGRGILTDAASPNESTRAQQGTPPPPPPRSPSPFSAVLLTNTNQSQTHSGFLGQRNSGGVILVGEVRSPQELGGERLIPRRPVLHQDSGWRMREESPVLMEDVPPHYTAT